MIFKSVCLIINPSFYDCDQYEMIRRSKIMLLFLEQYIPMRDWFQSRYFHSDHNVWEFYDVPINYYMLTLEWIYDNDELKEWIYLVVNLI